MAKLLEGKVAFVAGLLNHMSIAAAIAKVFTDHGAQVVISYQGEKTQKPAQKFADTLSPSPLLVPCDASNDEDIVNLAETIKSRFGKLDSFVHSIAFAPPAELQESGITMTREGFLLSQNISTFSLYAMTEALSGLLKLSGGSITAMTFLGAERIIPHYNAMGLAKASLNALIRALAYKYGPFQIRSNGIAAGPITTMSGRAIPHFSEMKERHAQTSPLLRNVTPEEIANLALFLASDLSTGITGEIINCDAGYNIMGVFPQPKE